MSELANLHNFIVDMDGVLWRGDRPMSGLVDFFATLRDLEINYVLATNNATKTAAQYTKKLAGFGVDVAPEKILTSAETTASYLRHNYPAGTAVYVIGDPGLHDALRAQEFVIVSPEEIEQGAGAKIVVVGFTRNALYQDFAMGTLALQNGAQFIGTNPDPTFPSEIGNLPGAGALQAVLVAATGIEPTIIGKPSHIVFDEAVRRLGGRKASTVMVGDRLTTDVAGAKAAGLHAILLLSGIAGRDDLAHSDVQPDFVFDDIMALAAALRESRADGRGP